ncbi:MAG TPA: hypothetical protein DEB40_05585 [Elusimicrobia bacterium]|nr:hypothetical protein [Elusimicrobiota bacterium]HBT61197.1 hypothetical protein [Elusimicrobiota bacterium]
MGAKAIVEKEPRFLADSMLGKLARWLALLGYDAVFAGSAGQPDTALLERARREDRIFLTRDTRIPPVSGLRMLVLRSEDLEGQLLFVMRELGLKPDRKRLFTRCACCNLALETLPRRQALALVPPLVRELPTDFRRCPGCGRVYWSGTHTRRAAARLDRLGL